LRLTQSDNGTNAVALARTVTPGNLSMTNGSWTLVAWFNRATQTNDNFIFYMGTGKGFGGDGDELQLYCPANTSLIALSHWNTNSVQDIALTPTNAVGTNQWHQVALVFQHIAGGTNNVNLFLDGAMVATTNLSSWALRQDYPLVFGGHNSTTAKTYRWFNGSLADLALFHGVLSLGELAALTNRTVSQFGGFTVTNTVTVTVAAPANTPPVLAGISDRTINAGFILTITNAVTDTNLPPPVLTFRLPVAPTNAVIATNTGILVWRPLVAQANTTNPFSVTVADNGTPSLSTTQSFIVTVNPLGRPQLTGPMVTNGQISFQISGAAGPDYTIQASTNLSLWTNLSTITPSAPPFSWTDTNAPVPAQRFYRVRLGP